MTETDLQRQELLACTVLQLQQLLRTLLEHAADC